MKEKRLRCQGNEARWCTAMPRVETTAGADNTTFLDASVGGDTQRRNEIRRNDSDIRAYPRETPRSYDPCKEVAGNNGAVS